MKPAVGYRDQPAGANRQFQGKRSFPAMQPDARLAAGYKKQ
jgi:hypothetical protein